MVIIKNMNGLYDVLFMNKNERRDSIVLKNNGQKIFGILHTPIDINNCPAVLICHGLAGDKIGRYRVYVALSEMLAQNGIASLRIDFRGSGDSEGDFSDMTLDTEVSDALKGLEFLQQASGIDPNRIGIFGRSIGGTVALMTARRNNDVKSIVSWAPLSDGDQWLEQWKQVHSSDLSDELRHAAMRVNGQIPGRDFFTQLFNLRMQEELESLEKIPFLHIHGEKDVVVVIEHASRYAQFREGATGKSKFIRLPKSDHDFSDPAEQKIALTETCKWFKDTL